MKKANDDFDYTISNFFNLIASLIKLLLAIFIALYIFLYFTRPDPDITQELFNQTMQSNGYRISYSKVNAQNTVYPSTIATRKDKALKINYVNFGSETESRDFYNNFTRTREAKHVHDIVRDLRIDRIASEKQSYLYEDDYYIALYTKDAVIYCISDIEYKDELNKIFDKLRKAPNVDFSQLKEFKFKL